MAIGLRGVRGESAVQTAGLAEQKPRIERVCLLRMEGIKSVLIREMPQSLQGVTLTFAMEVTSSLLSCPLHKQPVLTVYTCFQIYPK